MDILFDYKNEKEVVDEYQQLINDMETFNSEYTELVNKYNNLFDDPEKQANVTKIQVELYDLKQEFLQHMKEYAVSDNKEHLLSAMKIYNEQIINLKKRLHNIEYNILEIYKQNEKKDIFIFNKQIHTLSNIETSVASDSVTHFVVRN
jgi:hypothetical protein